jgi:hypothetical protein
MVEEIALVPVVTQNQDDEDFNTKKLHGKLDNIQHQRKKFHEFNR